MTSALAILERSFQPIAVQRRSPINGEVRICGVYALIWKDVITYIGASSNIRYRIWQHWTERRNFGRRKTLTKTFNRAIWHPLPCESHPAYEGALIRFLNPSHNIQIPSSDRKQDNEIIREFGLCPEIRPQLLDPKPARATVRLGRPRKGRTAFPPSPFSDETDRTIHDAVRRIVAKSGLSTGELAGLLRCHGKRVRRLLDGTIRLTARDMHDLALALGVPLFDLFGGDPSPSQFINRNELTTEDIAWQEVA